MKKLLTKLVLFSIINTILSLNSTAVLANNPVQGSDETLSGTAAQKEEAENNIRTTNNLDQVFEDIEPCFALPDLEQRSTQSSETLEAEQATQFNPDQYPALQYLITVIEEPLETNDAAKNEEELAKIGQEDFVSITCYRNVFRWTGPSSGEIRISDPALADACSVNAQIIANKDEMRQYNAAFSCKPVQVLLTRGGTSTIEAYIGTIYRWGASLGGLLAVAVIILNGIRISLSGGDSQAVENAKTRIVQSIGGLVLLFLSGLILYTINPNFFVN